MNFDETRAEWLLENYIWLNRHIPGNQDRMANRIAFPNKECFPARGPRNHAFATDIFDRIRLFMGISDWACELSCAENFEKAFNEAIRQSGIVGETHQTGAAGTFEVTEKDVVYITYSREQLENPISLVATLAHELCHYLLATIKADPPTGWEDLEPLTDLTAVKEGFGIFLCRSAFQFDQYNDGLSAGWSYSTQGYLSQSELAFCLAMYVLLHEVDITQVARHFNPNPREYFYLALDDLEEKCLWTARLKQSQV